MKFRKFGGSKLTARFFADFQRFVIFTFFCRPLEALVS